MTASKLLSGGAGLALAATVLAGCGNDGPPGSRDVWSGDVPEAVALTGEETYAPARTQQPVAPATATPAAEPETSDTDDEAEPTPPVTAPQPPPAMVAPPPVESPTVEAPRPPAPPPGDKPEQP
jgi:outer membrane biosynthesis protein TonB